MSAVIDLKAREAVLGSLRRHGRSPEDSEDILQEALLRMYTTTAPVQNPKGFLIRAARNLSIDLHRKRRPDLGRETRPHNIAAFADIKPLPEDCLDHAQRLEHVSKFLIDSAGRLTRDVYFSCRMGYSYEEIASHFKLSHITIRRHIARAVMLLMEFPEPAA